MTFKEKLAKTLGKELMDQIEEVTGDDFDWNVVPKARLDKVIKERNELRDVADYDTPAKVKAPDKAPEKDTQTKDTRTIADVEAEYQKKLADTTKRFAVLEKLRGENARNPELVLKQLDFEKITTDEKGEWLGYTEQIDSLKKSDSYLFGNAQGGTGRSGNPGEQGDGESAILEGAKNVFKSFDSSSFFANDTK